MVAANPMAAQQMQGMVNQMQVQSSGQPCQIEGCQNKGNTRCYWKNQCCRGSQGGCGKVICQQHIAVLSGEERNSNFDGCN